MVDKLFFLFMGVFLTCLAKSCSLPIQSVLISKVTKKEERNFFFLNEGIYAIKEGLTFPSNSTIIGNNTTIEYAANSKIFPIINLSDVENVTIKGLTIKGPTLKNSSDIGYLTSINYNYAFLIKMAKNITISDCHFESLTSTAIKALDVNGIDIKDCTFKDMGLSTYSKVPYSYDGIYLGGKSYLKNATITNCTFTNIGTKFESGFKPWPNDGDGIQILSSGDVESITIRDCIFEKCSARGVKMQAGDNVVVENNIFREGKSAVIIPMAQSTKNIKINNNKLFDIDIAFGTDKAGEHAYVNDIEINNNEVDNCVHFFRTSGESSVKGLTMKNNTVDNIGQFFLCGRFYDAVIQNNRIKKYGSLDNKSFNMAVLLTPESDNVIIKDNSFGKALSSSRTIDNRSKKRITITNNEFKEKQ